MIYEHSKHLPSFVSKQVSWSHFPQLKQDFQPVPSFESEKTSPHLSHSVSSSTGDVFDPLGFLVLGFRAFLIPLISLDALAFFKISVYSFEVISVVFSAARFLFVIRGPFILGSG